MVSDSLSTDTNQIHFFVLSLSRPRWPMQHRSLTTDLHQITRTLYMKGETDACAQAVAVYACHFQIGEHGG